MDQVSRARIAVIAMFFFNGALLGAWAARIPAIVARFELSEQALGLLLLCIAAGAIASFPLAGALSDRIGAARLTRMIALAYAIGLALVGLAPTVPLLAVALLVFGAGHGAMDVTMNVWAAEVERARCRPIMASFHAMWSLGGGLGALLGAGAAALSMGPGTHFTTFALISGAAALWAARVPWSSTVSGGGTVFALPARALLMVGLLALCSSVIEGAMTDWSAVFLSDALGASEGVAPLGYVAFAVTMVAARLTGDRVTARLGPVRVARISGMLASIGIVGLLIAPGPFWSLPAFVFTGLGVALIVPLCYSRAASDPDRPAGQAMAGVATLGYGGMLIAPAAIGFVAHASSLSLSFAMLAILGAGIWLLAGGLARPR